MSFGNPQIISAVGTQLQPTRTQLSQGETPPATDDTFRLPESALPLSVVTSSSLASPMAFGAIGDGQNTTDDTAAVQAAFDSGKIVLIDHPFSIKAPIQVTSGTTVIGGETVVGGSTPRIKVVPGFVGTTAIVKKTGQNRIQDVTFQNVQIGLGNTISNGIDFSSTTVGDSNGIRLNNVSITSPLDGAGALFNLDNCGDTVLLEPAGSMGSTAHFTAVHWANTAGNNMIIAPSFAGGGQLVMSSQMASIWGGAFCGISVLSGGIEVLCLDGSYVYADPTSNVVLDASAAGAYIKTAKIGGGRLIAHSPAPIGGPYTGGTLFKGKFGTVGLTGANYVSAGSTGGNSLGQAFDSGITAYAGSNALFKIEGGSVQFFDGSTSGAFWNTPPTTVSTRYSNFFANSSSANQILNNLQQKSQVLNAGMGVLSQPFDINTASQGFAWTSGDVRFALLPLNAGDVVTNILFSVEGAGASLTHLYVGLFKKDGTQLAVSADTPTAGQSAGPQSVALTSPYTVPADDVYYAAFLTTGASTMPSLTASRARGTTTVNFGSGSPSGGRQTGQTTMPSPATISTVALLPWLGVN